MINEQSTIAVIGDSDLATLLRLAGLGRYYIIEKSDTIKNDVRNTMNELVNESGISIIAIQVDYAEYVRDIINDVAEEKRLFPVIIEVPSKNSKGTENAAAYYRAFVRKFVGFDIEI